MRLTKEIIMAARTPRGGFTKETLAGWGIAWPPRKGWIDELLASPVAYIAHDELDRLEAVRDDSLRALPILITMLRTANLPRGVEVAEQMLARAQKASS